MSGQLHAPAALSSGKQPQYPLCRRLGGPQSQSGRYEEEKCFLPLKGIEPRFIDSPTCSLVAIPTEVCQLPMYITRRINFFICTVKCVLIPHKSKAKDVTAGWRILHDKGFIIYTLQFISLSRLNL
jgi:hypothetical protein